MATLTIRVTNEDIRDGRQLDAEACPVAWAICRELSALYKVVDEVSVGRPCILCTVRHCDGCFWENLDIDVPEEVYGRIETYDRTGEMEPFTFEIEVPA
jgi:hypothetical protein